MSRVVVIGAGLAGLVAALRLAEGGHHVTVVARGTGNLHLSPGTLDVLGYSPSPVNAPHEGIADLLRTRPAHPYAHLRESLDEALAWFIDRLPSLGYTGGTGANMLLPTAVGVARPTAFAPASMAAGDLRQGGRFVAVGLSALKDFFPRLLADNLTRAALPGGVRASVRHAETPVSPRPGTADVATQVFARALDDRPAFRAELGDALRALAEPGETILMPAVLGLARARDVWSAVQDRAGLPVAEVPTVPPSLGGMRLNTSLVGIAGAAGVRLRLGPQAVGCAGADGRITHVHVRDAARVRPIAADAVVLATGGFAAGGLELDSHGVLHETALGLPVSGPPPGEPGLSERHLDHQPLMASGIAVDGMLRPIGPDGEPVWHNLHAAGTIVAGAEPWREKSGEGIAIAGGYRAAGAILEET